MTYPEKPSMKDSNLSYHIVLTTHNSRISARMRKLKIKPGLPVRLLLEEEIKLTEIIGNIIKESKIYCFAYNICVDHVHMILWCPEEKLINYIQKIKSRSSKLFHDWKRETNTRFEDDDKKKWHLWSQKFFRANLDNWEFANHSNLNGSTYFDTYISRAIPYIQNNRKKHNLQECEILQKTIDSFVTPYDSLFS